MQQGDLVDARDGLGVRNAVPQLERALEQQRGLPERVDGLGRDARADARAEGGALVAGRGVVMRDPGGQLRARGAVGGAALERARERAVELDALAREQVVGDDLAQERVAERVAVVGLGDDKVARDALAQGGDQLGARQAADARRASRDRRTGRPRGCAAAPAPSR